MSTIKTMDRLSYDSTVIIGKGTVGNVFKGSYRKNLLGAVFGFANLSVAVKRIQKSHLADETAINREVEPMLQAGDHPNILRYICTEMDDNFWYKLFSFLDNYNFFKELIYETINYRFITTELCQGTLEDYVNEKYKGPKFQSEREIIRQVSRGLTHLHSLGIVHRDIKPTNILVFVPRGFWNTEKPQMKLADFGISKVLKAGKEDFTNTSVTNPSGTRGWMAPEVYEIKRFDFAVDIFALGCIFGFTLSGGKHPFGDDPDRRIFRIVEKKSMILVQKDLKEPYLEEPELFKLIQSMLEMEPARRPSLEEVMASNIFHEL